MKREKGIASVLIPQHCCGWISKGDITPINAVSTVVS